MNRNSKSAVFVALLLILAACRVAGAQEFKTGDWLADFEQLKKEMSAHYANLEWAVDKRGLDLKQQSGRTESRLRQAVNAGEAQAAIEAFLNAFGDGHLEIQWRRSSNNSSTVSDSQPSVPAPLCERLGYRSQEANPRIAFSRLSSFSEIKTDDSKYFSVGVLNLPNNRTVGVLRIELFSEYRFPDLCEQAATELGLTKDSACDAECDERVERKAADLLTAALARQIEVFKRRHKTNVLLVDITGNGGGTNWAEPAARTFTPVPLRSPRQAFIRHEHWAKQLKARLDAIEADLRQPASSSNRALLLRALSVLRKAVIESQQSCPRDAIGENQKINCSLVALAPPLYPQSILAYAVPDSLPDKPSSRYLFYPSRYKYREGLYSGKLMILTDRGTASSAEYFAAMLRDNRAATIIGEPTYGAGCGYTNGGIPIFLKNSGARVKMPDCVRLRADGSNEVEGVTPDVLVPWSANDTRYQRAQRVYEALAAIVSARSKRRPR